MDDRTMPNATFRCPVSGDQSAPVELTYHKRRVGELDVVRPVPKCQNPSCSHYRQPMELLQLDYQGETV